jgi:hypothetical protein
MDARYALSALCAEARQAKAFGHDEDVFVWRNAYSNDTQTLAR